jgi:hypothetical protein
MEHNCIIVYIVIQTPIMIDKFNLVYILLPEFKSLILSLLSSLDFYFYV